MSTNKSSNKNLRKNVSFTNVELKTLLDNSSNASKLIEEALIFFLYSLKQGLLDQKDITRVLSQKLVSIEDISEFFKDSL